MESFLPNTAVRFLVYAVLFLLPWHTGYIFSFDPASSPYTRIAITLLDVSVAIALFAAIPLVLKRGFFRNLPRTVLLWCALFLLSAGISVFFARERGIAGLSLLHLFEGAALFVLYASSLVCGRMIAWILASAASLQALFAMAQFFSQSISANTFLGLSGHLPAILGDSVVQGEGARILRAYGSFPHPNALAAFLGLSFLGGIYLYFSAVSRSKRIAAYALSMIILAGMLFTFSRGTAIALAASGVSLSFLIGGRTQMAKIFFARKAMVFFFSSLAIITSFSLIYWQPVSVRLGLTPNARLEERSIDERISYLQIAFFILRQHPFGIGIGQYVPFLIHEDDVRGTLAPLYTYQPVHSHPTLILVEMGAIGFVFFILFLLAISTYIFRKGLKVAFAIAVFLFALGLFDHYFWTIQSGILIWWVALAFMVRIASVPLLTREENF